MPPTSALPLLLQETCRDLALTSSRLANGVVTVEVARRQPDGTWLWVLDQPSISSPTSSDDLTPR